MTLTRTNITQYSFGFRLIAVSAILLFILSVESFAQLNKISIVNDATGTRLQVNNQDFLITGVNWDYIPIGSNYSNSLWTKPDEYIKDALDREMSLLKSMGINTIRQYTGVQPRWIKYIYENYGIYTVLNHSFGRYGVTINGAYNKNTDYADPASREQLLSEIKTMVDEYQNTPGLLIWLLGNENNYGLFWGGAATENIPVGETLESVRARHMYALFEEAIQLIKKQDSNHPIAIANGDLLFIDIIAKEVKGLDIFGTNMYRGISFGDAFQKVKEKLGIPMMFSEFGADAYNARTMSEDQLTQARYFLGNWKEIYENTSGKGKANNCIGGFSFQFSDGWWKHGMDSKLDIHDADASWSNGGYKEDYVEGENNMNEEWFGICSKGTTDQLGHYELFPRASFYSLKRAYVLKPYAPGTTLETIDAHFKSIEPFTDLLTARGDKAALQSLQQSKIKVSSMRMDFETYSTGGKLVTTPTEAVTGSNAHPAFKGFDHLESFYAEIEGHPSDNISGKISVNMLGNIPQNPIDEIFYENRGLPKTVLTDKGPALFSDNERVKIYQASISWDNPNFKLDGFYRTGHYHWGYEGDFFGVYPEANYGINADIYNANAPLGFEIAGKKSFEGLKVAFGPELWWGANPAVLVKYRNHLGPVQITGIYQDDIAKQGAAVSSFAVPIPINSKGTLHIAYTDGVVGFEVGGIWSGSKKVGQTFQIAKGSTGNYTILQDKIKSSDTYGGKIKFTFQSGPINWYAQGAAMGLVAEGGAEQTLTYTGWRLKDCGSGNQYNVLSGLAYSVGNWQIAPNFLWQKPIEGPLSGDVPAPGHPRNILSDPFAVRGNRETTAGELLINFDPTPATWMFAWDNDIREDAQLAFSAGFVYRHQPTTKDAAIGILGDGRTLFAFPEATKARDIWEVNTRIVSKLNDNFGLIANLFGGPGEPNGSDQRLIHRYGGDIRVVMNSIKLIASVKVDDWGPYDYHRDFNITYPLQLMADMSTVLGMINWFNLPQTQLGVRYTWRSLDQYSNRYAPIYKINEVGVLLPYPTAPGQPKGNEWEVRTYLRFNI